VAAGAGRRAGRRRRARARAGGLHRPLALLATDPETPFEISLAAQNWLETCTYGLWQVADPALGPGVRLTEIVSGARRYAAIPSEQFQPASRWSVFLGALVAIDGI